jgi:hypothetical protein
MPVSATIQFDKAQLADAERLLADVKNGLPRAMRGAIKRTGNTIKSKTVKAITSELNLKQKDINIKEGQKAHRYGGVRLSIARPEGLSGRVSVTGQRIPLYRFGAKELGNKRNPKGVRYQVGKNDAKKTVRAFIAPMKSGHIGVFMRMKKPRFPINEYFGPSIPHAAEKRPEMKSLLAFEAGDMLNKNFASQIDYLVSKRKARD